MASLLPLATMIPPPRHGLQQRAPSVAAFRHKLIHRESKVDKPDWKEIDRAVYLVGQSFGHETAHLSAADQIKAARNVILDMCDTIEQLASESETEAKS